MKPLFLILTVTLCWSMGFQPARATDAPPLEIPSGQLLKCAPKFSQWVLTLSYPEERDKKISPAQLEALSARTRTITTTKFDGIAHEEFLDTKGNQGENWYVGTIQYMKPTGAGHWYQTGQGDSISGGQYDPSFTPLPPNGFRNLEWITCDTYVGTMDYLGKSCFVFVPGGPAVVNLCGAKNPAEKLTGISLVAFVDASSRFPVEVRNGGVITTYEVKEMSPISTSPLPPDLLAHIKQVNEGRARLNRPLAKPY